MEPLYEKLGKFYLGKPYDLDQRAVQPDDYLLYDSQDLTTHAVCVGMTGSGKTGLCLSLLEEAAIDQIPAIAIDPKGDLGNLLLTFPELRPADFAPWVEPEEAARSGATVDEYAAQTAERWRSGLAEWEQDPQRIARFRDAVDVAIYTPGSSAGLPLTVLRSFAAPNAALLADADALRERITAAASGLLALLGVDADPIRSREHILLSNLLDHAWRAGRDLDLGELIRAIQTPPLERIGFVDMETFYPAQERFELAMRLNNLLASPAFAGWMEGEPLDVRRLLYTPEGKPRLSILSIAHLSEAERMFFVTILLNEVLAWARAQPGTSSLRAILYMDEVFGYFPPTANPPSKTPMLTLLKQARAYGLGVVLATQNPVDLDYKGLSNTGTWFLGRLQTERDKLRVLEGLEGASTAAGASFNKQQMEATLAGLGKRVFLMHNVHEEQPVVFHTRWCLSYLRGPMTRGQISTLMAPRKTAQKTAELASAAQVAAPSVMPTGVPNVAPPVTRTMQSADDQRPLVPAEAGECFLLRRGPQPSGAALVYRPALLGAARVHYVDAKANIDHWQEITLLAPVDEEVRDAPWDAAEVLPESPAVTTAPELNATFAELPAALLNAKNYKQWQKDLEAFLYRAQRLTLWECAELKEYSRVGESEGDFRVRLRHEAHEARDREIAKLRQKYDAKLATLEERARRAEQAVAREQAQLNQQMMQTAVSLGSSLLGALLGRKASATTAMRGAGRSLQQRGDVGRAAENVAALRDQQAALEAELKAEVEALTAKFHPDQLPLTPHPIRPRKSDLTAMQVALAWRKF